MNSSVLVNEICALFLQCNHYQQLEVLKRLPRLICRDFIGTLPLPAVTAILQHLPLPDVLLSCLKVCKTWRTIIQQCDPYWMWVCLNSGLTAPSLRQRFFSSDEPTYFSFTLRLLCHISKMKQIFTNPKIDVYAPLVISGYPSDAIGLYEDSYGVTAGRNLRSGGQLYHLVMWAAPITKRQSIVLVTRTCTWYEFDDVANVVTQTWADTEVMTHSKKLAICKTCELIVEIDHQPFVKSPLTWKVNFIKLYTQSSIAQRSVKYLCIKHLYGSVNDYIPVLCVAILPKTCSLHSQTYNTQPGCINHQLLILIGECVVIFTCKSSSFLEPTASYCNGASSILVIPGNPLMESIKSLSGLGTAFCISQDNSIVAFISGSIMCVWNILNNTLISKTDLSVIYEKTSDSRLIAVGGLYTIVQIKQKRNNFCYIIFISTLNGQMLHSCEFCGVEVFAPTDQEWLNSLIFNNY